MLNVFSVTALSIYSDENIIALFFTYLKQCLSYKNVKLVHSFVRMIFSVTSRYLNVDEQRLLNFFHLSQN